MLFCTRTADTTVKVDPLDNVEEAREWNNELPVVFETPTPCPTLPTPTPT